MRISSLDSYYNDYTFLTSMFVRQLVAREMAERELGDCPDERATLLAAQSLQVLNQLARNQSDSSWRDDIYRLKSLFLQQMFALGYLKPVELCRQDIKCNRCDGSGIHIYYHDDGNEADRDYCWHCNGSGIYKKVLLYIFRVKIGDKEFTWHQPQGRVSDSIYNDVDYSKYAMVEDDNGNWVVDLSALPKFKELKASNRILSLFMFQRHLLRLAVYVTKFQMFERLELDSPKQVLLADWRELWRRVGRKLSDRFWRVRSVLERVGLVKEELPF